MVTIGGTQKIIPHKNWLTRMLRSFELVYYSFKGELLWIVVSYLHVIHQPLSISDKSSCTLLGSSAISDQHHFRCRYSYRFLGVGYRMGGCTNRMRKYHALGHGVCDYTIRYRRRQLVVLWEKFVNTKSTTRVASV